MIWRTSDQPQKDSDRLPVMLAASILGKGKWVMGDGEIYIISVFVIQNVVEHAKAFLNCVKTSDEAKIKRP